DGVRARFGQRQLEVAELLVGKLLHAREAGQSEPAEHDVLGLRRDRQPDEPSAAVCAQSPTAFLDYRGKTKLNIANPAECSLTRMSHVQRCRGAPIPNPNRKPRCSTGASGTRVASRKAPVARASAASAERQSRAYWSELDASTRS